MRDLVWVRIFFPNFLVIEFFSLTYKATVLQVFPCKIFFPPRNQFEGHFLLKSSIPPQKLNARPLLKLKVSSHATWNNLICCKKG